MITKRLFALAPLQVAQALVGFGAIAAFTRLMTPEEFGRYAPARAHAPLPIRHAALKLYRTSFYAEHLP
ncbi:MAG: hypothetical protein ABUS48_01160 [Pseudomonadota bacterium]